MIRQQTKPATSKYFRSPGAMGYTCDHIFRNPAYHPDGDTPFLIRCQAPAKTRITLFDGQCAYVSKRCPACADILHAQIARGAVVEILNEEAIDVTR